MLICSRVFTFFIVVLYGSACFAKSSQFNSTCVSKGDDIENGDSDVDENDNEEENSGSGSTEYSLKRTTDDDVIAAEIVKKLDGPVKSIEKTLSEIKVDHLKKFIGDNNIMEGIRNAGENLKEEFRKSKDDYNVLMKDVMDVKYVNNKLKARSTPGNQQWGGRLVSAVGVFDSNLGKLKTAAENGDAIGVFSAISSMAGGILSVFPSAPAVFGGAFLQLLSTFISFGGSFEELGDSLVMTRIDTAVLELKTDRDREFLRVLNGAQKEILKKYEAFAPQTKRFSQDKWLLWGTSNELPSNTVGTSQLTEIETWVDERIKEGLYDNIYEMIVAYVSIASIVDKVFFKKLELMPLGEDTGYCKDLWVTTNNLWNARRKDNLKFLVTHLVPDYQKIFYLQSYFPPGNDGISSEIYDYARSLSYKSGSGETRTMNIMEDPPVVNDGEYWLESVAHTGYYMTLAHDWNADWNQYITLKENNGYCRDLNATRRWVTGGIGPRCHWEMKKYKIGRLITLTKKDVYGGPLRGTYINIKNHASPLHHTLSFKYQNGIAKFVIDSEDSDVHLENAELYATTDVHKNELPRWSKKRLTTSSQFKIIPLTERKPGEPMRVVIGMVTGDRKHFLRTGAWSSVWHGAHMPIYMKTLTQNGVKSGIRKYRVDNSFRWLLHPTKK